MSGLHGASGREKIGLTNVLWCDTLSASMEKYYAHSGIKSEGISPQLYSDHVRNVTKLALKNASKVMKKCTMTPERKMVFYDIIRVSSIYHDMGKLDSNIQPILSSNEAPEVRLLNHVDAGVAYLLKEYNDTGHTVYLMSAFFVLSHHIGLQDWLEFVEEYKPSGLFSKIKYELKEMARAKCNIKEEYGLPFDEILEEYTNRNLPEYVTKHRRCSRLKDCIRSRSGIMLTSLQLRMAFSCFVDADHQDTANHFSNGQYSVKFPKLNPATRLRRLKRYTKQLSRTKETSQVKSELRKRVFSLSENIDPYHEWYLQDATVGNAKTTGALCAALEISRVRGQERIYSVAPFTNIIDQTVEVYRDSVLSRVEPSHTINEIHSKIEFVDARLRKYNNIWNAPINVTTAVQWIEGLTEHKTGGIRRLHLFANSVIIMDEFHCTMRPELWSYILNLLRDLVQNFNTVVIFSSGSSVHYWGLEEFSDIDVHEIIPHDLFSYMLTEDSNRVGIERCKTNFTSFNEFSDFVVGKLSDQPKSAMIVLNTIFNSIMLTRHFQGLLPEYKLYHLSSYLTPSHRSRILKEVKQKLSNGELVILIATSIVECGVDMSFDVGFRQKCSLASTLQFNGRINREHLKDHAITYVFDFDPAMLRNREVTENPAFAVGKQIFDGLDDEELSPAYCTSVIREEQKIRGNNTGNYFKALEIKKAFKTIGENFHIIDSNTMTVIIDPQVIQDLLDEKYVPYRRIMTHSVQIWLNKLKDPRFSNCIEQISVEEKNHFIWRGGYDDMFGIGHTLFS